MALEVGEVTVQINKCVRRPRWATHSSTGIWVNGTLSVCIAGPEKRLMIQKNRATTTKTARAVRFEVVVDLLFFFTGRAPIIGACTAMWRGLL